MKSCPIILGMPTIFRVIEVIKESEISKLTIPWASSRVSWLMRGVHAQMSQLNVDDVANKSVAPLSVDEVVRVSYKCKIPPFSHKVIHGSVGLVLQGYGMNVMTHGLEKRSPLLPLGVDIQSTYATLATGSNRVAVALRNNTWDWLEIRKGTPVPRMEVIKESEISKLAIPWASSRVSWLMRGVHARMSQLNVDDVANKSVAPLSVDEVVQVSYKCKIPPFGHKVIHSSVGLVLQG